MPQARNFNCTESTDYSQYNKLGSYKGHAFYEASTSKDEHTQQALMQCTELTEKELDKKYKEHTEVLRWFLRRSHRHLNRASFRTSGFDRIRQLGFPFWGSSRLGGGIQRKSDPLPFLVLLQDLVIHDAVRFCSRRTTNWNHNQAICVKAGCDVFTTIHSVEREKPMIELKCMGSHLKPALQTSMQLTQA